MCPALRLFLLSLSNFLPTRLTPGFLLVFSALWMITQLAEVRHWPAEVSVPGLSGTQGETLKLPSRNSPTKCPQLLACQALVWPCKAEVVNVWVEKRERTQEVGRNWPLCGLAATPALDTAGETRIIETNSKLQGLEKAKTKVSQASAICWAM